MRNKMIDLHNALFAELETLQDENSYMVEDDLYDEDKINMTIKRAEKVCDVADRIIELQKLQLDVYKIAKANGSCVALPTTLSIEENIT